MLVTLPNRVLNDPTRFPTAEPSGRETNDGPPVFLFDVPRALSASALNRAKERVFNLAASIRASS